MTPTNYTLLERGAHCCHTSVTTLLGRVGGDTLAACADQCRQTPACSFFSHTAKFERCDLCTSCSLTAGGRGRHFDSWVRSPGTWTVQSRTCEPPQQVTHCKCSALNLRRLPAAVKLPACAPSSECGGGFDKTTTSVPTPASRTTGTAAIALVYGFFRERVRSWYLSDPMRSYFNAMRLLYRLVLSLKSSGTTLSIHLLLSGERNAGFEAWLVAQGVNIVAAEGPKFAFSVPKWSSPHQRGAFSHLMVLSLTQFSRVVVLDIDTVVLRSLDHLALMPAPAFVYRWTCYPTLELNSGTMLLEPSESEHSRMQAFLNGPAQRFDFVVKDDPNTQSVWRQFYRDANELPVGYNAFKNTALDTVGWSRVHVLHDVDVQRKAKQWRAVAPPSLARRLHNLTQTANAAVAAECARQGLANRG